MTYYQERGQKLIPSNEFHSLSVKTNQSTEKVLLPQIPIELPHGWLRSMGYVIHADTVIHGQNAQLVNIDENHGRSNLINKRIDSVDDYGHWFRSLVTKGDCLYAPIGFYATRPPIARAKVTFFVRGLQTDQSLGRVAIVSEFMRKNGMATEALVAVDEPILLPAGEAWMAIPDFKNWLLKNIVIDHSDFNHNYAEYEKQAQEFLEGTQFIRTIRAMTTHERLQALRNPDPQRAKLFFEEVFQTLTFLSQKNSRNFNYADWGFDKPADHSQRESYLLDYIPRKLQYWANLLLQHQILLSSFHTGNWLGTLDFVDLDSVESTDLPFGDNVREEDVKREIRSINNVIEDLQTEAIELGHVDTPRSFQVNINRFADTLRQEQLLPKNLDDLTNLQQRLALKYGSIYNFITMDSLTYRNEKFCAERHREFDLLANVPMEILDYGDTSKHAREFHAFFEAKMSQAVDRFFDLSTVQERIHAARSEEDVRQILIQYKNKILSFWHSRQIDKVDPPQEITPEIVEWVISHICINVFQSAFISFDYIESIVETVAEKWLKAQGTRIEIVRKTYGDAVVEVLTELEMAYRLEPTLYAQRTRGEFAFIEKQNDQTINDMIDEGSSKFLIDEQIIIENWKKNRIKR